MARVLHRFHPRTLAQAPELATLAALDKVLFLAARVLVAEHPTLSHHEPLARRTAPATLREGRRILRSIIPLRAALARYRRAADLAIVYLMLFCGLRTCEVLRLELGDLQVDDARLRIRGKGNRERVMPLPEAVMLAIRQYLQLERPARCSHARLFVILQGARRGAPITAPGVRSLFRQRRGQLALLASVHAHRLRHTFGTDMARAGVRLPVLQKMMGHSDAKTTLQYIQLSMADIATEYRRAIVELDKRYGRR